MPTRNSIKHTNSAAVNYLSGVSGDEVAGYAWMQDVLRENVAGNESLYVGPGLADLQVNGVNGIDFNNPALQRLEVKMATEFLLRQGITSFLPTVISNSTENTCRILHTIHEARRSDILVHNCIPGIHLEGPFLSPVPGAKGAHSEKYLKLPDWQLFEKFQQAAGGNIILITIAPELAGAIDFIRRCREQQVIVSIGHSMADNHQVQTAADAGATMATHLGNAVPLSLPRHPNILWDLLANDVLSPCIIADGIHVPDSFIKVVLKARQASAIIVSDATCFAGMPPGEYSNHIGGMVVLDAYKRVFMKGEHGLLAGAAKTLLENVETLLEHKLTTLEEAWNMATIHVVNLFKKNNIEFTSKNDFVIFQRSGNLVRIRKVVKSGQVILVQ